MTGWFEKSFVGGVQPSASAVSVAGSPHIPGRKGPGLTNPGISGITSFTQSVIKELCESRHTL